jgi:hypothetical protein
VALDAADDGPSAAAHERSGAGSGGPVIERLQGADDHPACMARINRTPAAGCGVTMPRRSVLIDGLKVLASQLIVLHHMMLYAPMADLVAPGWPSAATFLTGEARFAVQVFLVVGGFLAAQGLARGTLGLPRLVLVRYLRLVPMLAVALLAVLAASALLPPGRWSEWVTPWPSPWDFLAHLLLLQDLLHIPSLSAGAWYVSIDFQLYCCWAWVRRCCTGVPTGQPGNRRCPGPWRCSRWPRCSCSTAMRRSTPGRHTSSLPKAWACWPPGQAARAGWPGCSA